MTISDSPPLPQSAVYILLAIGPGERHGYSIMAEVARMTGDAVRMGPGTLYTSIGRLVDAGLIEESTERPDPELDDTRRRYYRLTATGHIAAEAEVERLQSMVAHARRWLPGRPA